MTVRPRFYSLACILVVACALAFVLWVDLSRIRHVEFVSNFSVGEASVDARTESGFADGKRWLVVPEHNNPTYQWIRETQQMAARGDWRVRSTDTENAPYGREVSSASPYRWWLVFLAWVGHLVSGKPLVLCIERAALYADPLLHIGLLVFGALFVARRFGGFCASLFALGLAGLFPIAAAFLPGVANDFGLGQVLAIAGTLLLVSGTTSSTGATRLFCAAGIVGGCGLWIGVAGQVPIIAGVAVGAILAVLAARRAGEEPADLPWRAWALAGAITSLLAYLIEFFPGHMQPQLRVNYPVYGLAWLGLGELLGRLSSRIRGDRSAFGPRGLGIMALSAAAVASLPLAILRSAGGGFLADDLAESKLANLPDGVDSPNLLHWMHQEGARGSLAAALLPLLIVVPSLWLLLRGKVSAGGRRAIAIALGPVLAALVLACFRIRWWTAVDGALLSLVVASVSAPPPSAKALRSRGLWAAVVGVAALAGVLLAVPDVRGGSGKLKLTRAEVEGLYERALGHWIADHAAPDTRTILAPPFRTSSLCFYGGLRGLGSQNWENKDGFAATSHIVTSMTRDESQSVIAQRGVNYIVLPSWDTDLDELARLNLKYPESSFVYALHRYCGGGFGWLRPLPYEVPPVEGLEEQSVLLLQVIEPVDNATAQGRVVEYLVEMHQIDRAAAASESLRSYPSDLGALSALAQLAKARGDDASFGRAFRAVVSGLSRGADRRLAWDRRVSMAVVLALGGRADLARAQVVRCLAEVDGGRLRSLTTESLYHFLLLGRMSGVAIDDPALRALSLKLLPESVRSRM